MDKKLSEFKAGDEGDVKSVAGEGRIRRRLFDMGITTSERLVTIVISSCTYSV